MTIYDEMRVITLPILFIVAFNTKAQQVTYPETPAVYKLGGEKGFYKLISDNFNYPTESQIKCMQGKIFVEYVIT